MNLKQGGLVVIFRFAQYDRKVRHSEGEARRISCKPEQSFGAVGEESLQTKTVIQRAKSTAPRIKRVHSNSNRKNTFSDYEFSIFIPVLNFFHAHRVSAKELRSKSLNLFAIRHECRTEIRSARLAEESHSNLARDLSLSLNMTQGDESLIT